MALSSIGAGLSRAGAVVGGLALAAMIAIITLQVLSRRVLASPMVVADELSGYLLVVTTFPALGYAQLHGDHIQVTLLTDRLSPRAREYLAIVWYLVGIPFVSLLVWRSAVLALESFRSGSFSVSATNMVLWPIQAFVPAGLAILALQMVGQLADTIGRIRRGVA